MTDEATSPLFQATAPVNDLVQTTASSGKELFQDTAQVGKDFVQGVGNFMSEPSQLFQPAKAVSTLWTFTKEVASFGVESVKGTVQDVVGIGKDVGAIWSEPSPTGGGLFQPQKPLEGLANIWGKVLQSWWAIAGGIVKAGMNVVKKGIGIFKRKNESPQQPVQPVQ